MAVAVAPSKPEVVYAFIETVQPKDGLYRSDDGGKTWQLLDRSAGMIVRPFYFANLIVDLLSPRSPEYSRVLHDLDRPARGNQKIPPVTRT